MLVRAAGLADAGGVAELVREYWQFEGIGGFEHARVTGLLEGMFAAPSRAACWVAESGGRLVGYLLAVYLFSLEHGGIMAEIDEFYVGLAARAGGLGAQLLAAAERDMRKLGIVRLQLQLGVENLRAGQFYRRHGFAARAGYALMDKSI